MKRRHILRRDMRVIKDDQRAWFHSYVDAVLDELERTGEVSDARFQLWARAVLMALRLLTPERPQRILPKGCVTLDDPRWMEAA